MIDALAIAILLEAAEDYLCQVAAGQAQLRELEAELAILDAISPPITTPQYLVFGDEPF